MNRSTLSWLVGSALLWAGAGAAVTLVLHRDPPKLSPAEQRQARGQAIMEVWQRLGLSGEQEQQIRSILDAHTESVKVAYRDLSVRILDLRSEHDAEIVEHLTPEQISRLEGEKISFNPGQ